MKILHHIIKILLFLPITTLFIIIQFIVIFFELLNGLHPKNFYSFQLPSECDILLEIRPDFEFILRLITVIINPFFNFFNTLK